MAERKSRVLAYGLALVGGVLLGGGSALALSGMFPGLGALSSGDSDVQGWKSDWATGSGAADR